MISINRAASRFVHRSESCHPDVGKTSTKSVFCKIFINFPNEISILHKRLKIVQINEASRIQRIFPVEGKLSPDLSTGTVGFFSVAFSNRNVPRTAES